jgi:hypothetical protein
VKAEVEAEVEAEAEDEQEEADEEEAEEEAEEQEDEAEAEDEAEEAPSLAARLGARLPTTAPPDTSPPVDHTQTGPWPTPATTEEVAAAAEVAAKAAAFAEATLCRADRSRVVVTRPPMPSAEQIEAMDTMVELRAALEAQGESGVARSKQVLRGRLLSLAAVRDTARRQIEELRQEQGALRGAEEALRQAELHPFTADAQYDRSEILARVDPLKPRANGAAPPRQDAAAAAAAAADGKPARGRRRLASTATWEEAACDGRAELAVVLHAVPSGSPAGRAPKPRLPAGRAFHDALRNRNCK